MAKVNGWGQVNREAYSLFKAREYRKAFALYLRAANAGTLHPRPFTLNTKPLDLNPTPSTLNPACSALSPKLLAARPLPCTSARQTQAPPTPHSQHYTASLALRPKPSTLSPTP